VTPEEVITTAISDEGGRQGSSIHSWRCDYPDRYGPCDCVAFVANVAIEALTAAGYSIVNLPSRDQLATLLLGFLNPPLHDGSWTYNPTAAADAVLALLRGESP
jgi:hypothetical protein